MNLNSLTNYVQNGANKINRREAKGESVIAIQRKLIRRKNPAMAMARRMKREGYSQSEIVQETGYQI